MPTIDELSRDLAAEHQALDDRLDGLEEEVWSRATPAEGWRVRDQISHLWYFDGTATLALTDPKMFTRHLDELRGQTAAANADRRARTPDIGIADGLLGAALFHRWRDGRAALLAAIEVASRADPKPRVPWYGPPMSLASFVTARLMETWAHGVDITDTLGFPPVPSDRLRHVCHIGVGARAYSFAVRGIEDPGDPVRVEATAPGGESWTWGPEAASDRVAGSALDLALVFTQRRNRHDTDVTVAGPTATAWMDVAQAFAGPPGPGRPPTETRRPPAEARPPAEGRPPA